MGKHEKVYRYFNWNREHRAKMIAAQYPGIENEGMTAKWVLRGIKAHPDYMSLAQAWRVTGAPPTLSEM